MSNKPALDEIGREMGTDKSSAFHDYLRHYEPLFAPFRDRPVRLMEQGVLGGHSMRTWAKYFTHPDAVFVGVEPHDFGWVPDDPRMRWVRGKQENAADIDAACTAAGGGFEIIIDDAGHFPDPQMAAFKLGWPLVSEGGVYIIEDLHSAWMPAITPTHTVPITRRLYDVVDELHDHGQGETGARRAGAPRNDVKEIRFIKSACIFIKQFP